MYMHVFKSLGIFVVKCTNEQNAAVFGQQLNFNLTFVIS